MRVVSRFVGTFSRRKRREAKYDEIARIGRYKMRTDVNKRRIRVSRPVERMLVQRGGFVREKETKRRSNCQELNKVKVASRRKKVERSEERRKKRKKRSRRRLGGRGSTWNEWKEKRRERKGKTRITPFHPSTKAVVCVFVGAV